MVFADRAIFYGSALAQAYARPVNVTGCCDILSATRPSDLPRVFGAGNRLTQGVEPFSLIVV